MKRRLSAKESWSRSEKARVLEPLPREKKKAQKDQGISPSDEKRKGRGDLRDGIGAQRKNSVPG